MKPKLNKNSELTELCAQKLKQRWGGEGLGKGCVSVTAALGLESRHLALAPTSDNRWDLPFLR